MKSTRLAPEDLCTLPLVQGVSVAPGGDRVAYSLTTMDLAADKHIGVICVAAVDGSSIRRCTEPAGRDARPRWSADGKRLLFLSDRSGRRQVWLLDVDREGAAPQRTAEIPGNVSEAAFSPDGRFVAAVTLPDDNRRAAIERGWRRIGRVRYRADGFGYLDDFPQIWLIDVQAGTARQLDDGRGSVAGIAWSPDGKSLAYAGEHRDDADSLFRTELWIAEIHSGEPPRKIAALGGALEAPSWSSDGTTLACVGHDEAKAYGLAPLRLYEVTLSGGAVRCVAPDAQWTCGIAELNDLDASPATIPPWHDEAGGFVVAGTAGGTASLYRVERDGASRRILPPTQSITDFAASTSTFAFCATDSVTPPEVYVADDAGRGFRRITFETRDWCESTSPARAEKFAVSGSGGRLDAWRIRARGGSPRPCVLEIHGGPHFAYGESFMFEFQLLAAAGFDVVFCNPRGSQGYGDAFASAIVGDWAAPAFDDCIAALDAAIAQGDLDPRRLGIAGGSYGGYLTLWSIAHTDRFGAAVAMRSASNLASLWGTSEVGRMLDGDLGADPWADPELYRSNSPLTFAQRIRTPTLFIHAANDYRCPIEQADQMFTALKKQGTEVEFLHFLAGDHGLSRTGAPRLRVARLTAILDWFRRHLTGTDAAG